MGWSAGGHLALLYAYKERRCRQSGNNCDGCALENSCNNIVVGVGQHPIKLVISEAGPTNFLIKDDNGNSIPAIQNICNLVGITENDSNTNDKLFSASPIKYVTVEEGEDAVDVPYTILAYGSGISCGSMGDGDGTVAYSQATSLAAQLAANKYMLYPLPNIAHLQFGSPQLDKNETIETTVNPDNFSNNYVKNYYLLLKGKLESLNQ